MNIITKDGKQIPKFTKTERNQMTATVGHLKSAGLLDGEAKELGERIVTFIGRVNDDGELGECVSKTPEQGANDGNGSNSELAEVDRR